MTVRTDRIRLAAMALIAATTSATGVWAKRGYVRSDLSAPVIAARIVSGPSLGGDDTFFSEEPTIIHWIAPAAPVDDSRVGIGVTGARWYYDVPPASTQEQVRDGLLAVLTADPAILPGVMITASGTDRIVLDASGVPGLLYGPVVFGAGVTRSIVATVDAEVSTAVATCVLEFEAFASGAITAQDMLADLIGSLHSHDTHEIRELLGVVVQADAAEPLNLDALAGPTFESRAAVRTLAGIRSYRAVAVPVIEVASITVNATLDTGSGPVTVSETIEVNAP